MDLHELLEYWTDVLGLQEWDITLIANCSPNDMTLNEVAGGRLNGATRLEPL